MVNAAATASTGHKTYFGPISEGRSSNGEKIDPHKIVIAGLDPESDAVAAQSAEAASIVSDLTMPTSEALPRLRRGLRPLPRALDHDAVSR